VTYNSLSCNRSESLEAGLKNPLGAIEQIRKGFRTLKVKRIGTEINDLPDIRDSII
jgi:hypothetical protein